MEKLEMQVGQFQPALVDLVMQCLHNGPGQRPCSDDLLDIMQYLRVEVERVCGMSVAKPLDIGKLLLAKTRIEELEVSLSI